MQTNHVTLYVNGLIFGHYTGSVPAACLKDAKRLAQLRGWAASTVVVAPSKFIGSWRPTA